jgi:hypothetical protein
MEHYHVENDFGSEDHDEVVLTLDFLLQDLSTDNSNETPIGQFSFPFCFKIPDKINPSFHITTEKLDYLCALQYYLRA